MESSTSQLTVTVSPGPGEPPVAWLLTCDPPGGDHPDPVAACAALDAVPAPFDPVPPGTISAQVWGGPQTATITGTWRGVPVSATYNRINAAESARWNRLAAVFRSP